jgi:hypothetical protein
MAVVIDGTSGISSPDYEVDGVTGQIYPLVSGTAVTASGTSVNFTGIPSWVKRITVVLSGVSTNAAGSSVWIAQLGNSGGIETSGYLASAAVTLASNNTGATSSTAGFPLVASVINATTVSGLLTLINVSGNVWVASYAAHISNAASGLSGGGNKTLSGTLDRVRITTVNGTDTFDAGTINIIYE